MAMGSKVRAKLRSVIAWVGMCCAVVQGSAQLAGSNRHSSSPDLGQNVLVFDSSMAPGGSNDWARINASFKTSDKTEAIMLKIVRVKCDEEQNPVCPIFGSVWYDDLSLKRRN